MRFALQPYYTGIRRAGSLDCGGDRLIRRFFLVAAGALIGPNHAGIEPFLPGLSGLMYLLDGAIPITLTRPKPLLVMFCGLLEQTLQDLDFLDLRFSSNTCSARGLSQEH